MFISHANEHPLHTVFTGWVFQGPGLTNGSFSVIAPSSYYRGMIHGDEGLASQFHFYEFNFFHFLLKASPFRAGRRSVDKCTFKVYVCNV